MTKEEVEDKIDETRRAGDPIWYYKWRGPDADPNKTFGPFSTLQMTDWLKEGFFGEGETVVVRREGETRFLPLKQSDFE